MELLTYESNDEVLGGKPDPNDIEKPLVPAVKDAFDPETQYLVELRCDNCQIGRIGMEYRFPRIIAVESKKTMLDLSAAECPRCECSGCMKGA